jgi:hypothetical protein
MIRKNPSSLRSRHRERRRNRANFWDSVKNLFKRICEEGILKWLLSLTKKASDSFYHLLARRKSRNTRQTIQDFNRSITLIADIDALIASIVARIKELFDTNRVILLHAYPDSNVFS